ncbi:hypothetical protein [Noviherbaspirillum aridicola]|uniref:Uncharacterized protein n=1 Tax=Noviherbaspirillum aridicola TaxID=2849687 RepID=A0ABQ4Q459_9BURK|nr:hypothetical protein [Noviherbaspirillum aridicola]GIZ51842.1 hypothetical protein NCCP691_18560 [Noviherbaspirillum aridicola]
MSSEQDDARREPALVPQAQAIPVLPAWPPLLPLLPLQPPEQGLFSFRYACTEITIGEDGPAIRRREARYADGRLVTEEWEGMLAMQAYQRMLAEAQGLYLRQLETMFRLLTGGFFPDGR